MQPVTATELEQVVGGHHCHHRIHPLSITNLVSLVVHQTNVSIGGQGQSQSNSVGMAQALQVTGLG
jgi:hypothetical protein